MTIGLTAARTFSPTWSAMLPYAASSGNGPKGGPKQPPGGPGEAIRLPRADLLDRVAEGNLASLPPLFRGVIHEVLQARRAIEQYRDDLTIDRHLTEALELIHQTIESEFQLLTSRDQTVLASALFLTAEVIQDGLDEEDFATPFYHSATRYLQAIDRQFDANPTSLQGSQLLHVDDRLSEILLSLAEYVDDKALPAGTTAILAALSTRLGIVRGALDWPRWGLPMYNLQASLSMLYGNLDHHTLVALLRPRRTAEEYFADADRWDQSIDSLFNLILAGYLDPEHEVNFLHGVGPDLLTEHIRIAKETVGENPILIQMDKIIEEARSHPQWRNAVKNALNGSTEPEWQETIRKLARIAAPSHVRHSRSRPSLSEFLLQATKHVH